MSEPRKRRRRRSEKVLFKGEHKESTQPALRSSAADGSSRSGLQLILPFFLLVVLAIGNGRNLWLAGCVAFVVGALALLFAPKIRLPLSLVLALTGVLALPLLAFVPASLWELPQWRQVLATDFGLALPATWTPQPGFTLENWAWMLILGVWFAWSAAYWQDALDRAQALRLINVGLNLLALAALVFYFIKWQPPTWGFGFEKDIGPYANRNHFSCLMAMNAVLCCAVAHDLLRRKEGHWPYYALGIIPSFAVVLVNTSLGGLIVFILGILSWMAMAALRARSLARIAVTSAIMLILAAALLFFGQHLLGQVFDSKISVFNKLTEGGRPAIYLNTLDLIFTYPMVGVGLGNFASIFGFTHEINEGYVRFRHPESDWLWFAAEAGLPALACLLFAVIAFIFWLGLGKPSKHRTERRDRRLRLAAGLAVIISLCHGLVDVPNHALPHALLVAFLASLGLSRPKMALAKGISMRWPLRFGGGLLLGASAVWFGTALGYQTPFSESVWTRDLGRAKRLLADEEIKHAAPIIESAIEASPLSWEAYFVRAECSLKLGLPSAVAAADFARARALEPNVAKPCMVEGELWLSYDPMMALPAWREALRREHQDEAIRYQQMLDMTQAFPQMRAAVRSLAVRPRLMITYLANSTGAEFEEVREQFLARYPNFSTVTDYDRLRFFQLWRDRGNHAEMIAALKRHDEWLQHGWQPLTEVYASQGKFQEAYQLARRFLPQSSVVDVSLHANQLQLEKEFLFYPSDPQRGFRLYSLLRQKKNFTTALSTLKKMAAQPDAPSQVDFELGVTFADLGDFESAWRHIRNFIYRMPPKA